MRVLIVDDLEINRKLLRFTFGSEGYQTFEASDGIDALGRLARTEVDAVVSDILMPNMDGYSFCRKVRSDPKWDKTAFIIYTSTYVSPGDRQLALDCGADAYLRKPAPANELLEILSETVRVRSQKEGRPPPTEILEDTFLRQYNQVLIHKLEERNLELQQLVEELSASEEKFRRLVENLGQVFFLTEPDGLSFHYVSPAYESIWGHPSQSLFENSLSWTEAIVPEERIEVRQHYIREPGAFDKEFRIRTPWGEEKWIRSQSFEILDESGVRTGICGLWEDITRLRLSEAKFQQAQKLEGIGKLASGVAHDFNNLLTAIYGFNFLASQRISESHPARRHLVQVDGLVQRAAKLTQQLLAFSRRQIFKPAVVDLNALLSDAEKMFAPLLGEDVNFVLIMDPELGRVHVDPSQIEQVVMNLCVNSRDAMPQGGQLTITTRNGTFDDEGDGVVMTFSDTGTGIAPDVLKQIFEPFFTTKVSGRGTGLGLATCYGIIAQSGGHIHVDSVVGEGTTFRVVLPRTQEVALPLTAAARFHPTGRGGETLLIVEDDEDVLSVTSGLLEESGFRVLTARDASEADEQVQNDKAKQIRLLLADLVMPGRNGKELADEIRLARPDIQVLFTSGYSDETVLRRGIEYKDLNYLRKPYSAIELGLKVREVLDRA